MTKETIIEGKIEGASFQKMGSGDGLMITFMPQKKAEFPYELGTLEIKNCNMIPKKVIESFKTITIILK